METQPTALAGARPQTSLLRSAGAVGAATFISRITGLVREQAFAYLFGAGNAMDAYNIAFRIPNLLRDLFAEGAMSASLVPTFTRVRTEEGDERAWRVAGLVFRLLAAVVSALALVGILFASPLVSLYAGAFKAIPGKFELTVRMTRTMFPFFPLVALAAAFMGILNACGVFFLPSLASALFNVISVAVGTTCALILFHLGPQLGIQPIEGMALGVVLGGAAQAFCQLPRLYKVGYRWRPRRSGDPVWRDDPALKRILWMMVPGTIGLAATQVNLLVNSILATSCGPHAVSWLNYAFRLMQFPIGVFGVSIAQGLLPRISQLWVDKDAAGVSRTITGALRHVFAINLPASAGLAFLGAPIIALIFQYGRFTPEDTRAAALALAMYSIGLTAYSAVKVLVPACYALGNTKIPVISSGLAVGATVLLNLVMVRPFGFWGLALGTSCAAIFNMVFLVAAVRRLIAPSGVSLPYGTLVRSFAANLAVALAMGVACHYTSVGLGLWLPESEFIEDYGRKIIPLVRLVKITLLVAEGVGVVVLLSRVFGLRETTEAVRIFTEKLKKKLRRGGS